MLDIGSWEFMLIIVLGIVVIGPKELPGVIRTVGAWVRRAKELAREFQGGLEEIARETEIEKFKSELENELGETNSIGQDIAEAVDPDGEFAGAFDDTESDWYSDHEDDAEGVEDVEGGEVAGPPVAEDPPATSTSAASDAADETVPDDPVDSDAKTGA
jgi:sec-independent protein translocase protein TatB